MARAVSLSTVAEGDALLSGEFFTSSVWYLSCSEWVDGNARWVLTVRRTAGDGVKP